MIASVLLVPNQGGGRVALVLMHQSDEAFRLILVHFTFGTVFPVEGSFVGIAVLPLLSRTFSRSFTISLSLSHTLKREPPRPKPHSRIAVTQPDDCIQDTCLERIERDLLRSERLSRTVPVGGEEGVGGFIVPYRPLKRAGGGTFDILMGITIIFGCIIAVCILPASRTPPKRGV